MTRPGGQRREYRGTVLVMVIGFLVMFFVMGSAFLFVSRFEMQVTQELIEQSGQAGTTGGGSSSAFARLLEHVRRQLRLDVVGTDDIPFNGDLDGDTGSVREDYWDTPGWFDVDQNAFPFDVVAVGGDIPQERLGLQTEEIGDGLLAASEPYADPNNANAATAEPLWTWFAVSSFTDNNPRLSHQVVQYPDVTANTWQLPWGFESPNFGANYGAWSFRYDLWHERPLSMEVEELVPDADGDGYPDFLFATRDRSSDNILLTSSPPAELWPDEEDWESFTSSLDREQKIALRMIAHGGMVLLDKDTPRSLLIAATDRNLTGNLNIDGLAPYDPDLDPAIEEANLRRRNCLSPPDDKRTEFEERNFQWLRNTDGNGANSLRWFPFEYDFEEQATNTGSIPDTDDHTYFEDPWMTPPTVGNDNQLYDRRHLVTTISYDDLYRPNRNEAGLLFRLADWYDLNGDFQEGVLRQIGYLPDEGLRPADTNGDSPAGFTQFSLADLDEGEVVYTKGRQIRLLYAYYRAMLQSTEVDVDDRDEQAAMLAVNTWDYFDTDSFPTIVSAVSNFPVIGLNDPSPGGLKYTGPNIMGLEGMPFLTQVYVAGRYRSGETDDEPAGKFDITAYAIELFNPWPQSITISTSSFLISSGGNDYLLPSDIAIPAAIELGLLNPGAQPSNLAVISNVPVPGVDYDRGKDISNMVLTLGETVEIKVNIAGVTYVIDSLDPTDGDNIGVEWPHPSDDPDSAGLFKSVALVRGTASSYGNNSGFYALGRETGVESDPGSSSSSLGLGQANLPPAGVFPVPLFSSDSGNPLEAFPSTGSLMLVARYGHSPSQSFAEQTVADINLASGTGPITDPELRIDNGHIPVFDQEQYAEIDDDGQITVPWGQLVFNYFTALPLQWLNLDGLDYEFNDPKKTPAKYRRAYQNLLEELNGDDSLVVAMGLPVPIVERVPTENGFAYGPRVRGRININTAPWSLLDGVPLIQSFNNNAVGPVAEIDTALGDILNLTSSPIEETTTGGVAAWTLSPELARAIVAYREARQAFAGEADYRSRPESTVDVDGDSVIRLGGRDEIGIGAQVTNPSNPIRQGPGFVTVGELANVVHGLVANTYTAGDSAYRIDGFDGTVGGGFDDYTHAIAILASLPDWLTVKSNTYTVYATVTDWSGDEVEVTRGQWTVDRSRCLYTPSDSAGGLPEIIGPEIIVNYGNAANDPR